MAIDHSNAATSDAGDLVGDALAILELGARARHDNEEDFDMLQRACSVSMRLLEEAKAALGRAR
ncbi:hypothetical protein ACOPJQ_02450 [Luteimonas dalianensis]|uniref:hypothetical protein n=1 Tax=Luteimonas dalianensis TaxID=1148196 RepID=UPI003BF27E9D